jgi:AraC-like DNA-binding protein/biotin operon repressor
MMQEFMLPHHHGENLHLKEMKDQLDQIDDFQLVAAVFRQLDDTSRLRIFWLLCHREDCVINIASLMEMTTPAVSHHLKQLKEGGLIVSRREGKEVYYRAADTQQSRLLHTMIEQLMAIVCPDDSCPAQSATPEVSDRCLCTAADHMENRSGYQKEQLLLIRDIHNYLMEHLDSHITIEALAKQFLMNTTTLKTLFREAYGMPIAAHMKEHRMKKAATLLQETDDSISAIAAAVGYQNQSKFSAAFREFYQMTPNEYRRRS